MYTVYLITNLITKEQYVGSTIRSVYKRWGEHRNGAFNSKDHSYNYPLQRAIRKYGLENFDFIILKQNFNSAEEMVEYEYNKIIELDTYYHGYNQTLETTSALRDKELQKKLLEKMSQPCAKVDTNENIIEKYASYQEAARKNNIENSASHIRKVCKGMLSSYNGMFFRDIDKQTGKVIHQEFKRYKQRKAIVGIKLNSPEEEYYGESILQTSKDLHLNRQSIGKCIKGDSRYTTVGGYIWRQLDLQGNIINNGIDVDYLIERYNNSLIEINGEKKILSEWLQIYNLSRQSYYKRLEKGMTQIEAITNKKER